ncbi:unnamed protein product [Cercopithifilaria johnstoni]|uniref:Uncharacterized protein n=1 Tax=Cercopithifilaria johnstoni TaxID=2874296 RepID=A0A8J2LL96_9BILA|nr:unnamed protein product [Cercopithifilaria johnstoni]
MMEFDAGWDKEPTLKNWKSFFVNNTISFCAASTLIGCYPYIKYHCTKGPWEDFSIENRFYKFITVLNCGLPCLLYGLAARTFIRHTDYIVDKNTGQKVAIKFLLKELHS